MREIAGRAPSFNHILPHALSAFPLPQQVKIVVDEQHIGALKKCFGEKTLKAQLAAYLPIYPFNFSEEEKSNDAGQQMLGHSGVVDRQSLKKQDRIWRK